MAKPGPNFRLDSTLKQLISIETDPHKRGLIKKLLVGAQHTAETASYRPAKSRNNDNKE
jgi:hypothetical protein